MKLILKRNTLHLEPLLDDRIIQRLNIKEFQTLDLWFTENSDLLRICLYNGKPTRPTSVKNHIEFIL
jgi:hypothetical protein